MRKVLCIILIISSVAYATFDRSIFPVGSRQFHRNKLDDFIYLDATYVRRDGTLPLIGNWDIDDFAITSVNYFDFDLVNGVAAAEGRMVWNPDDGTLNLGMPGGNVNLQIGQEQLFRAKNTSGSTILNGRAVRITGASGSFPTIGLSEADVVATAGSVGVATEDISNNQFGYVTTFGLVRDIDTSGFSVGDRLYVSNTAGILTATPPTGDERIIFIAIVIVSNVNTGIIWVSPVNVSHIKELSSTTITTPQNNDVLVYETSTNTWINTSTPESEKAWSFVSPTGSSGTFYTGGYYFFNSGNNTFVVPQTLGTANVSYAAHAFIVAGASPASDSIVTVSGTSITDLGVRTAADSETLSVLSTAVLNDYFETSKKWIGQITVTFTSGDNTVNYNWGFCKYWDNNNNDFQIVGIEVTGTAGTGNDANPNVSLIHHKPTGWTYNAGSTPTPPSAVADMQTDHVTEIQFSNSQPFAWKRSNLSEVVLGSSNEGTIIQWDTTANKAVEIAHVLLRIRGN